MVMMAIMMKMALDNDMTRNNRALIDSFPQKQDRYKEERLGKAYNPQLNDTGGGC